jgi:hypothetical protein
MHSVYDDPAYADDRRQLTAELAHVAKEIGDDPPPHISATPSTESTEESR